MTLPSFLDRSLASVLVEDVLARRTRALFLNARAAMEMAPRVASLMARELGQGADWEAAQVEEFRRTARGYLLSEVQPANQQAGQGGA